MHADVFKMVQESCTIDEFYGFVFAEVIRVRSIAARCHQNALGHPIQKSASRKLPDIGHYR
jgi:hypothetical protein